MRRDLTEVGTRYEHLMELRDTFLDGIEVIKRLNPNWRSLVDIVKQNDLETAVELIEKQMELMAGFSIGCYELGRVIDDIQPKLTGGTDEPKQERETQRNCIDPSQSSGLDPQA